MRALVTGAAGFIGSTLVDTLLDGGHDVVGVAAFTPYYDPERKRSNLESARARATFELVEAELLDVDLQGLLSGVDVVFHQAAQPGVRLSWASGFGRYVRDNVLSTQSLLEACRMAS